MADDRTKYERYDLLVERHRRLIRKLCWRRSSGDEYLCGYLVQECYIVLLERAEGETVHIFDILGCSVRNDAIPTGIYLVKVGNQPARKVIVTYGGE